MKDLLTVAYLFSPTDNKDYLKEFLSDFKDTDIKPKKFAGIPGDLTTARCVAYDKIKTPYVAMLDPDDRVYVDVLKKCVDYLEANPDVAMCGAREVFLMPSGAKREIHPNIPYNYGQLLRSPLALHNMVVFRTEAVKEFLPALREHKFRRFDHALRVCVGSRYKSHKIMEIGYEYRQHRQSDVQTQPIDDGSLIPPTETVSKLVELGIISLPAGAVY
ncbi:MAG: hypothetical protein CL678_14510 [Bdellovibrionaceae bacterium]|nr:hypothetical protein [Pseudobdellovibrionaceae bacterium]|tara:strand:- start:10 stop:660 length:651 start_codon:yes stop_codon:yes gene_type:complete